MASQNGREMMANKTPTAEELVTLCDQVRAAPKTYAMLPKETARLLSIVLLDNAMLKARFGEDLIDLFAGVHTPIRILCLRAHNTRANRNRDSRIR